MEGRSKNRLWIVLVPLMLLALGVTARLVQLQLGRPADLIRHGNNVAEASIILHANRGYIRDRKGEALAEPSWRYEIMVEKAQAGWERSPDNRYYQDFTNTARILSAILDKPAAEIEQGILESPNRDRAWIVRDATPEQAQAIRETGLVGVYANRVPHRFYPQGALACHLIGYVDPDSRGGVGVEGYRNGELTGQAGVRPYTITRDRREPRHGRDIVLTIDSDVQGMVEALLRRSVAYNQAERGTIVVLDPATGAVIAMAADPCFEPLHYIRPEYENILINPTISRQYEPGSVMKMVTMAMGIDSGAIAPGTPFFDSGTYTIGGGLVTNAEKRSYGSIDMNLALKWSVNTAHAWVVDRMGPEQYYSYLERFNFGRLTGIDLAGEIRGSVLYPSDDLWTPHIMAVSSFGQSTSVTPLQMTSALGAIANGGRQMQPYVTAAIYDNGELLAEHKPTVLNTSISAETARLVTLMGMESGQQFAGIEGYTMSGKSGTAQVRVGNTYDPREVLVSFGGWLPAHDPRFVMLVVLEKPQRSRWGFETAAPLWQEVARELIVLLDIPPDANQLTGIQP
jgi:cell division protein FtsI/penicillin-binding protein 2